MADRTFRLCGVLLALVLLATACSDGDDAGPSAEDLASDPANAPLDAIDQGSGGVASGPIAGLLTVQPSFGFGVFDVNRATGTAAAVPGIASVETVDRNTDLIVSGGAAYTLGAKVRDGQTFASDISIVKIDYATGQVSQVAELGFDRETDDSDLISHQLQAVAGNNVLVTSGAFGGTEVAFRVFDANTGDEKASFPLPFYEFSSDSGTCNGSIGHLVGLDDGRVVGVALGSPAFLDLDSGEIELARGCDEDDPQLADFVTPATVNDFAVFSEGAAPTPEQIERLLMTDLDPAAWGFAEGGGDLWWIEADARQVDDVQMAVGGIVQFDLETSQVEAVHPLGANLGEYIDCEPDGDECVLTTIEQADLRWFDGRLIILDTRENGRLLTLDPVTGAFTTTELERGEGVDFTSADLLAGDPNGVWLDVTHFTITQDDENGRTSSGPSFIEHFDTTTNQIDLSLPAEDIFF